MTKVDDKWVKANNGAVMGQLNTQSSPANPNCIIYFVKVILFILNFFFLI